FRGRGDFFIAARYNKQHHNKQYKTGKTSHAGSKYIHFTADAEATFEQWSNNLYYLSTPAAPCSTGRVSGRIWGKNNTSWILALSVSIMARRSIPIPIPAVGGIPYSSARKKSWSMNIASSSPRSINFTCSSNLSRWSLGSFSSV